jgi:CRISPR-associated endonuclease/helicase Cas3
LDEPTAWDVIAERLQRYDQVLCVVNTRRDCYDLFKLMPDGTVHLSALMCGAHRAKVIGEIKSKLKAGQPIRVISTQLVEAGVDIDFPVVYRALSGLASIAQAAGRCNREGKLNDQGRLGEVQVFVPPKPSPHGMLRKGEDTTRELYALPDMDAQHPSSFTRYFNLFYSRVNDMGSQFHEWLVKDVNPTLYFQFRTAAEKFKLIDDRAQRSVIVCYGDSGEWLERLRFAGPTREIMRGLQRYMVSLPTRVAERMLAGGRLEVVDSKRAPGIVAQCSLKLYDDEVGLDIYKETFPVEDLVQ